jgi:hypothetical protein
MGQQSFVSVQCFNTAIYKELKSSFNTITVTTVIIISHKTQNILTTNNHHTMAVVVTVHNINAVT